MKILTEIFAVYIITILLVKSNALHIFRMWFIKKTPMLFKGEPAIHLINCRLCTSFWISLLIVIICDDLSGFFLIYGVSYFLATQER